jgi:hypothetical protein
MMTKATVLTTLLGSDKVDPKIAYQVSKITPDPEEAYRQGINWYKKQLSDQNARNDTDNKPNDTDGKKEGNVV